MNKIKLKSVLSADWLPRAKFPVWAWGVAFCYLLAGSGARAADMAPLSSATNVWSVALETVGNGLTWDELDNVPSTMRLATFQNGTPGFRMLGLGVNGQNYLLRDLLDGQTETVDVGASLLPGGSNTIVYIGYGDDGASALITLSEAPVASPRVEPVALQIAPVVGGLEISWPALAPDVLLQSRASLHPLEPWVDWPIAPTLLNGRLQVIVPASGSARFFRLK